MRFSELLKIELMKYRRSKIIPLIFIAPILVVSSGIANLSAYFTPEIHQRMAYHVYSERFALRLLPAPIQHDRCLRHDCESGNQSQRAVQNDVTSCQPPDSVTGQILHIDFLFVHGNLCIPGRFCHCRLYCRIDL